MRETYTKPQITAKKDIQGAMPVVGLLVAYAAGRVIKNAIDAHPIDSIASIQKAE